MTRPDSEPGGAGRTPSRSAEVERVGNGRRPVALAVAALLVGGGMLGAPAKASRPPIVAAQCAEQGITGPATDVNAQAGDGRITVGLNEVGTITVFKYPNPSFDNQVK